MAIIDIHVSPWVGIFVESDGGVTLIHEVTDLAASETTWAGICSVSGLLIALRWA